MNQANSHELNGRHFQNESIFTDHNLVFDHHDLSETCRNV
ncbi:AraC family transcriptional regulator, partial [Acinetobacter baumannii]